MAYHCPRDLDGFMPHLGKADTRFRQQVGTDLLNFLAEPSNPIICQDIGQFIDGIIPWMQSSNYKVSSNGIEVMTYLIDRLGIDFRPYIQTVLPNVIDRLGDAKDTVREKSQLLILKLLEANVLQPQQLLEKLLPAFSHKNAKIREEVLRCLVNTLNEHSSESLTLSKFIPAIVKLLSDPTATVRDTAFNTLVDLYRHVGEKLRIDLQKRSLVAQAKWPALARRFDEVRENGELLPTASKCLEYTPVDELDRITMSKPIIPLKKPNLGIAMKQKSLSTNSAGAVDEDLFSKQFTEVPTIQVFYPKEVTEHLKNIQDIISDTNKDWNKRADALKRIRSLVIAGATNFEEFQIGLKQLEIPLQATVKDLRSQVVREACLTIAFLAKTLGNKFDKTAEYVLQPLLNLIQNSAKIMATAGTVAVRFIIFNIHSSRLIPIVTTNATTSKSKDIRRSCCDFLEMMLTQWPTHTLERHVAALQDAVKKGVADADCDARVSSRKAFKGFRNHFPDQAEALLQSLEPSYRRALQGEGMSASSSSSNLASGFKTPRQHVRPAVTDSGRKGFRSNSAIDLQAAQRAKARAQYSQLARTKVASGTASLQGEVAQQARPRKASDTAVIASPERTSRNRNRNSQSQPTSRSGSPSSRFAYLYNRSGDYESPRPRRSSGIPRSTTGSRDTSRETSPSRNINFSRLRARNCERPPLSPASRPVLAQKILQQSREAENALADAFVSSAEQYRSPRKTMRSLENHSDESETSSVCSERSYDSYKRPSDSYSWSGSQQRLPSRDMWEPCRDINEIIALCASTNWQERKDGLISLQHYLANEMKLSPGELRHLTEIFTRMFMDSHTKGLSVFIDTLQEVIKLHKDDMHSWIYVLLQRVFLKIGTETLNSVQSKLVATLELIRRCFPISLLMLNVYRFLIDPTQTPNARVKVVVLNFLSGLCTNSDAVIAVSEPAANQALQKIILYAQDNKSMEIRNAAKVCLMRIWNCNTPVVTMMLAELPKDQQDVALSIVHSHMRKSSTGSEPGSPLVSISPKAMSPGTPPPLRDGGFDQEEIYKSLRKTTAEIQNYSFETLGAKLDRDRDTTSQDSGISQMSSGNEVVKSGDVGILEERIEALSIRPSLTTSAAAVAASGDSRGGYSSLPIYRVNGVQDVKENGEFKDSEVLKSIFENCLVDNPMPIEEKRKLLAQIIELIKRDQTDALKQNFKKVLRILMDYLNSKNHALTISLVLQILQAIFQCDDLKECWENFVELLTLKVAHAYCDDRREIVKDAEETATTMSVFPITTVIQTLAPLITTSSYPEILGATKMLTRLVEVNPEQITDHHLSLVMIGVIKGTDHAESPVRKSSIFCLVALYRAVGDDRLANYLKLLSGSKMKLLHLYINRAQQSNTSSSKLNNSSSNN